TRVDYNVFCDLPWVISFCVKLLYYRVFEIIGSARLLPELVVGYVITNTNSGSIKVLPLITTQSN
ncbi:unnamed protein product, partial [Hymenolepis diminuta]